MRSQVTIIQVRVAEVQPGDIVNKRGPERTGWLEVDRVEVLDAGTYVVHDEFDRESFTATSYDLVWMQTLQQLDSSNDVSLSA